MTVNKSVKKTVIKTVAFVLLLSFAVMHSGNTAYAETKSGTSKTTASKTTSGKTTTKKSDLKSLDSILEACKNYATCQEDVALCGVDVENAHNPYDVEWDYGEKWQEYVDACDWSLVYDAKFYKKEFPMLAIQYNNDDELLFEHFRTVGVHEGRQGCESFNVDAYRRNCSKKVYDALKDQYPHLVFWT